MSAIRVAVNGFGVIGKRVADAVVLQDDMELVGVADVTADYRVTLAASRNLPLFGSTAEAVARHLAAWTFLTPVFGMAFGLVLTGERPGGWAAVGMLLVLASLWAIVRAPQAAAT
jgi:hypothetical protein